MFNRKGRISAILLVLVLSTHAAMASPRVEPTSPGVVAKLIHFVKRLLPITTEDPTFPHP